MGKQRLPRIEVSKYLSAVCWMGRLLQPSWVDAGASVGKDVEEAAAGAGAGAGVGGPGGVGRRKGQECDEDIKTSPKGGEGG